MIAQNYSHDRIISFIELLKNFIFINDQKINRIFYQQIEKLTERILIWELFQDTTIKNAGKTGRKSRRKLEGKAEGRHEEALEIARAMKKDKFPVAQTAKLTKLSIKEIEAL